MHSGLLDKFLKWRSIAVPGQWLSHTWFVADGNGEILIPHFDALGGLTAIKRRRWEDGWQSRSVRGSKLVHLYGAWRAPGGDGRRIYLCEGESDTWTVAYMFDGEAVDVVGLPSGAAAAIRPEWLDFVAGSDLVLLQDADTAGEASADKWVRMATGVAKYVHRAHLPDGTDCTSAGPDAVADAIRGAS